MGQVGHYTPDVQATFYWSLENVIKRSSSLGGQDYDTSLFPVIKGKPIPVTKLRGGQKKRRTCHNLALSFHLFIRKCWCKSNMSQALRMQKWTSRNNSLTHRIYCLLGETNITQIITCLTMKSVMWNSNDKTRVLSKSLKQPACPFCIC